MTGYQKVLYALLAIGFLLIFGGFCALEAHLPILGAILGGSSLLSFLSALWILRRWERKEKEEEASWYE